MASQLVAVLEHDTGGSTVLDEHLVDGCFGTNLGAKAFGGASAGHADAARPAFGEAPGSEGAVDLAHVVVEQNVRRSR